MHLPQSHGELVWVNRKKPKRQLGFRVHTRDRTRSEETTFLLIHGIGMSCRSMKGLHAALDASFHVTSVDVPGFCQAPPPDATVTVEEMARALGDVCDHLGLTNIVVIGHSMGAQWAACLATTRPDLVTGVVLIGPVVDRAHRSLPRQALALARDVLHEPPATNLAALRDYLKASSHWYRSQLQSMLNFPIEEHIQDLPSPILILRGRSDTVSSVEWCRFLRTRARNAQLVEVPSGAHNVQVSRPLAVASAVHHFVREHNRTVSRDQTDASHNGHPTTKRTGIPSIAPSVSDEGDHRPGGRGAPAPQA